MTPIGTPPGPPAGDDGTGASHVVDDLASLLRGELDRRHLSLVVRHLRACASCRAELVEASIAHSALTATRRVLDPRRTPIGPVSLSEQTPAAAGDEADTLPPLLSGSGGRPVTRVARVGRRDLVASLTSAAVAIVVALGGVAAYQDWTAGGARTTRPTAVQQATLTPVVPSSGSAPIPTARGIVSMAGTRDVVMTIRVIGLPAAAAGHFYYAWLLDASTNKMLPVGVVSPDGVATFNLEPDLVHNYTAVNIGLQADNGNPAHSDESVLRASYA